MHMIMENNIAKNEMMSVNVQAYAIYTVQVVTRRKSSNFERYSNQLTASVCVMFCSNFLMIFLMLI